MVTQILRLPQTTDKKIVTKFSSNNNAVYKVQFVRKNFNPNALKNVRTISNVIISWKKYKSNLIGKTTQFDICLDIFLDFSLFAADSLQNIPLLIAFCHRSSLIRDKSTPLRTGMPGPWQRQQAQSSTMHREQEALGSSTVSLSAKLSYAQAHCKIPYSNLWI
mgnify:CR=1 FL=1